MTAQGNGLVESSFAHCYGSPYSICQYHGTFAIKGHIESYFRDQLAKGFGIIVQSGKPLYTDINIGAPGGKNRIVPFIIDVVDNKTGMCFIICYGGAVIRANQGSIFNEPAFISLIIKTVNLCGRSYADAAAGSIAPAQSCISLVGIETGTVVFLKLPVLLNSDSLPRPKKLMVLLGALINASVMIPALPSTCIHSPL